MLGGEIPKYRSDRSYKRKPIVVLAAYNRDMFGRRPRSFIFGKYRDRKTAQQVIDTQARKWTFLDLTIADKD